MSDFDTLAASLRSAASNLTGGTNRATRTAAMETLAKVKSNASGRPGPRRVTGDYTRSWNTHVTGGGGDTSASIGTNAAQALRLEYGFNGTDSLGRRYHQPPFPHVRPAAEWAEPRTIQAVDQAVSEALG